MGSLTGKFSKGILGDFIFKAAVWRTSCFKSSVPGKRKQAMEPKGICFELRKYQTQNLIPTKLSVIDNACRWDNGIEFAKMEGKFEKGNHCILKPKEGPDNMQDQIKAATKL